jgi:hypothetical protein
MEGERWAEAASHLEIYFLSRLRFTGFRDHPTADLPFRRLLARLGEARLSRYHTRSLHAERHYLLYLAGDDRRAATGDEEEPRWKTCRTLSCAVTLEEELADEVLLPLDRWGWFR